MKSSTAKPALRLIENHDYISVVHTNWRFTMGRYGEKASGVLARDDVAFKALSDYVTTARKAGRKNGEIMKSLTDEKVIAVVWPAWNAVAAVPEFAVGDSVRVNPDASGLFKRYPDTYEVGQVARKYAYIKLPAGQLMGLEKCDLLKVSAAGEGAGT